MLKEIRAFIEGEEGSIVLQNPKDSKKIPCEEFSFLQGHVFIKTSGSFEEKWAALSRGALFSSAKAVNTFYALEEKSVWINPLPLFHVGGLSILFRASLTSSEVIPFTPPKWDPKAFVETIKIYKGNYTSLVPAQVFDLIQQKCSAPPSLKKVFIGGGFLSDTLFKQAKALAWPLHRTYGMTELCSQVAGEREWGGELQLLPHIEAKRNVSGLLMIKSPSLFSGYYKDKKKVFSEVDLEEGFFKTEDKVLLEDRELSFLGREGDFFKIGGEGTNLRRLSEILQKILISYSSFDHFYLYAKEDPRLEKIVALAVEKKGFPFIESVVGDFNAEVKPFEKIQHVEKRNAFERSSIGKIKII